MAKTAREGSSRELRAAQVSEPMHALWPCRCSFWAQLRDAFFEAARRNAQLRGNLQGGGKDCLIYLALYIWRKDQRHRYTKANQGQGRTGQTLQACLTRRYPAWASPGGRRIASPKGEHRRPPAFLLWHFGVILFLALVDLCDLGNMDMCKGGERERERYIYIYAIQ